MSAFASTRVRLSCAGLAGIVSFALGGAAASPPDFSSNEAAWLHPPGGERVFAPRKGAHALNALMGELYSVQPTPTHSDYLSMAQNLLRRHRKRSLVIIITNFRDEDSSELSHALRLLRTRHLVMLASLRERIVGELVSQPLGTTEAALDIGSAHLYEQARREAFNRLAARDALMVDAEPSRLGIELVNRYNAVKRAGMI